MATNKNERSGPKPPTKVEKPQVQKGDGTTPFHSVTPTRFRTPNPHTRGPLAGGPVRGR